MKFIEKNNKIITEYDVDGNLSKFYDICLRAFNDLDGENNPKVIELLHEFYESSDHEFYKYIYFNLTKFLKADSPFYLIVQLCVLLRSIESKCYMTLSNFMLLKNVQSYTLYVMKVFPIFMRDDIFFYARQGILKAPYESLYLHSFLKALEIFDKEFLTKNKSELYELFSFILEEESILFEGKMMVIDYLQQNKDLYSDFEITLNYKRDYYDGSIRNFINKIKVKDFKFFENSYFENYLHEHYLFDIPKLVKRNEGEDDIQYQTRGVTFTLYVSQIFKYIYTLYSTTRLFKEKYKDFAEAIIQYTSDSKSNIEVPDVITTIVVDFFNTLELDKK